MATALPPPVVICVGTSHPGNVGAIARGAANFGVEQLRFVAPRCEVQGPEALARAKHARGLLESAVIVGTLDEALEGIGHAVGTTARSTLAAKRFLRKPDDVRDWAAQIGQSDTVVGLVFGREDSGLTGDEVNRLDALVTVPTADYSSLNLAHAVTLLCYEVHRVRDLESRSPERQLDPATLRHLHRAFDALTDTVIDKPWTRDASKGMWRKLIGRSQPDDHELHAILGVFTKTLKRFDVAGFGTARSQHRLAELGLLVPTVPGGAQPSDRARDEEE